MTNREMFNQYIRMKVEKQLRIMESMNDAELVQYTIDVPGYHIETNIGNKLSYFKIMLAGSPVGMKADVIAWLGEEASENIDWEQIL